MALSLSLRMSVCPCTVLKGSLTVLPQALGQESSLAVHRTGLENRLSALA